MAYMPTKYQVSIFGNYSSIKPEPKTISKMIDVFSQWEMVPSHFEQFREDGRREARLMMGSATLGISVLFAAQRVDVMQMPINMRSSNMGTLSEFSVVAREILHSFLEGDFIDTPSVRVSLIADVLLDQVSEDKMDNLRKKMLPFDFNLEGRGIFEWGIRTNSLVVRDVGGLEESFNSIVNVSRVQGEFGDDGEDGEFDRIKVLWDFNTIQENSRPRFEMKMIDDFLGSCPSHFCEVVAEVEGVLNE